MNDPHAVRWVIRMVCKEPEFSKWHYTGDGNFSLCRVLIPVTSIWLPQTDVIEQVDCKNCLKILKQKAA